jgi:tRNA threonylcarbamoyladenosine biosynthesis protein TsaB
LLALDTSTRQASVAVLAPGGAVLAERTAEVSTHSETIVALIDDALARARVAAGPLGPGSLLGVGCGSGPGSFTGLRIGLATAKGLCFASSTKLVLVSSLAALAAPERDVLCVAALDAHKGEIYVASYREDRELVAPRALRPPMLADYLTELARQIPGAPPLLVGDALSRYPELASAGVWRSRAPHARDVGRLALARLAGGESDDLDTAVPTYVRAPEITEKRR